jgi:hypothetical protein
MLAADQSPVLSFRVVRAQYLDPRLCRKSQNVRFGVREFGVEEATM